MKIGPTNDFPHGKLNDYDKGGINIGIATDLKTDTVIVHFGTPVIWLGLPKAEALELADILTKKANELA